ncbi:MAG TPA: hypothetical protein VEZ17_09040 [Chitinophagaceae bacterium]|nr:hypothetical protein [Chitinophagaceae bacterium]
MKRYVPAPLIMAIVLLFTGCAKDNYEPPRAVLTGRWFTRDSPFRRLYTEESMCMPCWV